MNFSHWSKDIPIGTIVACWRDVGKRMDVTNLGHQLQQHLPDWERAHAIEGPFV
jgi:hypothetical protein